MKRHSFHLAITAAVSLLTMPWASAQPTFVEKITCTPTPLSVQRNQSSAVNPLTANAQAFCSTRDKGGEENDCDVIPVVVREAGGTCTAELLYSGLRVAHKKQANSKVTWVIWGPPNYKFDPTHGVVLIKGTPIDPQQTPDEPDLYWDPNLKETTGRTFTIKTKRIDQKGQVCHYVRVLNPHGDPCTTYDPVIANEPN